MTENNGNAHIYPVNKKRVEITINEREATKSGYDIIDLTYKGIKGIIK